MDNTQATCLFCDNTKDKDQMIEGLNGYLCKDCLAVCHALDNKPEPGIDIQSDTIDIRQLKRHLDKHVMGQEEVKKQLITEIYKHYNYPHAPKNNIMLIGDSGVGKTHIVRTLSRALDVPFLEVDATAYSETGYKGRDATDILDDLVMMTNGDIEQMERAIIFIDEVDKITSTHNGEPNVKIQHALLKIVEGMTYHFNLGQGRDALKGSLNTSKILFVGAGACVGLNAIRQSRQRPARSIGFHQELSDAGGEDEYTSEDLIAFGFIPEFIGRFALVLELRPLSETDIRYLLTDHPESPLEHMRALCARENIDLVIDDEAISHMVQRSLNHPLGIRSVSHELNKRLNNHLFDALLEGNTSLDLKDMLQTSQKKAKEKEY